MQKAGVIFPHEVEIVSNTGGNEFVLTKVRVGSTVANSSVEDVMCKFGTEKGL